jgi:uncharacterized protein (DUF58 family)
MAKAGFPNYARVRRDAERAASRFPALLAEAEQVAATIAHGVHGRRRAGSGETFWEYRHHRPEDGARAVDWRRSARGDHLYVRETEWEAANAIYLWRDGGPGMDAGSPGLASKRDRAAVCLIAAASLLIRGGERVAVLGETGRPRSGRPALEIAGRALADGDGAAASVESPDITRHARVVLASDFLDPPETWQARLSALTAQGGRGVLLRIIDPAEEDFPFTGRTRFNAPASGPGLLLGRAEEARTRYREVWAEHGAALSALARRTGWTLITHRTDRQAAAAVLALYQALESEA